MHRLIRSCTDSLRAGAIEASMASTYVSVPIGSGAEASAESSLIRTDRPSGSRRVVCETNGSGALAPSPGATTKKRMAKDKGNVADLFGGKSVRGNHYYAKS